PDSLLPYPPPTSLDKTQPKKIPYGIRTACVDPLPIPQLIVKVVEQPDGHEVQNADSHLRQLGKNLSQAFKSTKLSRMHLVNNRLLGPGRNIGRRRYSHFQVKFSEGAQSLGPASSLHLKVLSSESQILIWFKPASYLRLVDQGNSVPIGPGVQLRGLHPGEVPAHESQPELTVVDGQQPGGKVRGIPEPALDIKPRRNPHRLYIQTSGQLR
ncbi:hypothetical protein HKBW3S43_01799, partial [Candidatus Hakubella thermalkaliphila]